jgi:hypothetical protein
MEQAEGYMKNPLISQCIKGLNTTNTTTKYLPLHVHATGPQ